MRIILEDPRPRIELDPVEVLVQHPMASRTWFIDSRQRMSRVGKRSARTAMKMTPKEIMELCTWYEVNGNLFCRSKKTGRELRWNEQSMQWVRTRG